MYGYVRTQFDCAGVSIGVGIGVSIFLGISVGIGVSIGVGIGIGISVSIGVSKVVGIGIGVSISVSIGISICVSISVGECIGVGIGIGVGEGVGIGIDVGTIVCVLPETILADTRVTVDGVHTLSPMLTLVLQTVIVVLLTVLPHIAWQTLTPTTHTHCMYWTCYSPCIEHHLVSELQYSTL